jgi:hypothetical protein
MEIFKREKMWSSCDATYCTCLAGFFIRTLGMSVLEPTAKPNIAAARVLCKVLRNLRTVNAGWTVLELILRFKGERPSATGLSHDTARVTGDIW